MSYLKDKLTYYYNPSEGTYRVAAPLVGGSDRFVVVKIFGDDTRYTLKVWRGSLKKTASYWSTKRFNPNPKVQEQLDAIFEKIYSEFKKML